MLCIASDRASAARRGGVGGRDVVANAAFFVRPPATYRVVVCSLGDTYRRLSSVVVWVWERGVRVGRGG